MTTKTKPYTKDYVVGDVHAEWGKFNMWLNKKLPRTVFACGDFGWWPGEPGYEITKLKNGNTKIYFCDGNHENHDDLAWIRKLHPFAMSLNTPIEVAPNVFYCPRGTIKILDDGRKVLFMGGAYSIDKQWRTPGYDWFPGETINWSDMDQIDNIGEIDIVISHTCPDSMVAPIMSRLPNGFWEKKNDPSTGYLEWILEHHKPKVLYFGHWHEQCYGFTKGCKWTALNMISRSGFFTELLK